MESNAIIFSPHPDDETLGCGGTIIKKIQAGASIRLVFMTNGTSSHSHIISRALLKKIRTEEAVSAGNLLGVGAHNITFLDYEDGLLSESFQSAVHDVSKILQSNKPDEIFIPYKLEPDMPSSDHRSTNAIVLSALRRCKLNVRVYEYPVWLWYHPPWVSIPKGRGAMNAIKQSVVSGPCLMLDFNCFTLIGDVLDQKRDALNKYKSQMMPFTKNWKTLPDYSNNEFVDCFFQKREIFFKHC